MYWSALEVGDVQAEVATVIPTVPADSAGEVAVIWVEELTVKPVAAVEPKSTAVAPVKFVPVIVTEVEPEVEPEVGEMEVIVGTTAVLPA